MADDNDKSEKYDSDSGKPDKMFTLKKWNSVAMWSWDVECEFFRSWSLDLFIFNYLTWLSLGEICAICRVQVMDACLRCQAESKKDIQSKDGACVVGERINNNPLSRRNLLMCFQFGESAIIRFITAA